MRMLAGLALAYLLCGCAATPLSPEAQLRVDQFASTLRPQATNSGAFTIVDQRNADAAKVQMVSVGWAGGFSCFVGISQLGDSLFAPDRLARLENALAAAFPQSSSSQLVVRRYDIFLNRGAEADAAAWGAAMGSVGVFGVGGTPGNNAPVVWRRPKCDRDRMHSGWFNPADLANNYPPLTVELDVTVLGRGYLINAAHSPELDPSQLGVAQLQQSPAFSVMLQHAMDKAHARLIEQIRLAGNAAGRAAKIEPAP